MVADENAAAPYIRRQNVDASLISEENFGVKMLNALWAHAVRDPERAAMVDAHNTRDRVTFAQLYSESLSIAAFLQRRGFTKGDVYALVVYNSHEFVAALVGGTYLGGICTTCSTAFKPYELERQFKDSRATIVFTSSKKQAEVLEAIKRCPLVELVVVIDDGAATTTTREARPLGIVDYADVKRTPPMLRSGAPPCDAANDTVVLPYSSGTTGLAKGVMLTHKNVGTMANCFIWYNQTQVRPTFMPDFNPHHEAQVVFMPFYHCYGMLLICSSLIEGFTVVALRQFGLDVFCQSLQDFKAKQLYGVPPVFLLLAKSPLVDKYDLSALVHALTGAAPIGDEVCTELKRRLALRYVGQGFGMSETSMAAFFPDPRVERYAACGYLVPLTEAKVIDIDTGETLAKNKRGELCVRGPQIMKGYLNRPQATLQTIDREGWLHTGDVGYFDSAGQFYIVDRIKELIKVKGLQVAPAELEDLLLGHPRIVDVAVIGVRATSGNGEERPKAFVVRADDTLSAADVQAFVRERVAAYKQLAAVEFIAAIPKSPAGKLLRRELRELENVPKARL